MSVKIALAGNPNSGKTTLFNFLTGSAQYVGNWPGVTVEKKEGQLKDNKEVILQDLPGIYSLSPYTMEEVIARGYLVNEKPDAIINIVDATNIERNLYLTTQLIELGTPVLVALNMIDIVRKNGDTIDLQRLSAALGCEVIEVSALKGIGASEVAEKAALLAKSGKLVNMPSVFGGSVEHAIAHIEESIENIVPPSMLRWYAIKLFERDNEVIKQLNISKEILEHIDGHIAACEAEMEDDSESIIISQRYEYISRVVAKSVQKKQNFGIKMSDRIDSIVTNRLLALPIFAAIMFLIYYISVTSVGKALTDFTNDVLFGGWIIPGAEGFLEGLKVAPWLIGLIVDGIISGVGSVLGFVPQMIILFLLLAILEDVGYMSRVAFIMDRIFRKFGLSGKSFIPMLIGSGCSVPGIMASRTIENERDRRMTIMTTSFIPCGAKMPIIALIAGAIFGGAWWVAPAAYFIGVASVVISGIILMKTKYFAGNSSPFVMELPAYHIPSAANISRSTWDRSWSFIRRAGTVILVASVIVWFAKSFGMTAAGFGMVHDMDHSVLAVIGGSIAAIFTPLGFGNWQSAVATLMGLVGKEEVVGVFGVLYGVGSDAMTGAGGVSVIAEHFTALSGFSFLLFNLLCAPCLAAMGAIRREMNSGKWTAIAITYLCVYAYIIALIVYQLGLLFTGGGFTLLSAAAIILTGLIIWLLARKNPYEAAKNR